MKKYGYIYSISSINNKEVETLSIQSIIYKYINSICDITQKSSTTNDIIDNYDVICIEGIIDVIEISTVTNDIINNYDVICIDYNVINEYWTDISIIEKYLRIIKKCEHVCLLMENSHQWIFTNDKKYCTNVLDGTKNLEFYMKYHNIILGYIKLKKITEDYNIKNIISPHECDESSFLTEYLKCKSHILNLHIDNDIFRNTNIDRNIDILIIDENNGEIYPLQNKIKEIVKTMNIKYHIINRKDVNDHKLALILNDSWLTLCTSSVFAYLEFKYFEASACGSVIIGNMNKQGTDIWNDNYVNIDINSSDEEFKNIILITLSNKEKLRKIGNFMSEKIKNEYTYKQYIEKFKNICDNIMESDQIKLN